jgi:signal transduction histidine kinase
VTDVTDPAPAPAPSAAARARHDLLTPLNGVIGYAGIVLEDAAELGLDELRAPLREIAGGARELTECIRATLSGETDALRLPVLLAEVHARCAEPARRLAVSAEALRERAGSGPAAALLPDLGHLAGSVDALCRALAAHAGTVPAR